MDERFRENSTVELKERIDEREPKNLIKTIVAFANTKGGTLYAGVSDSGEVAGVDDFDGVQLRISNQVRDTVKPDVTMFVDYRPLRVGEKTILAVEVQPGTQRPYYLEAKGLRPEGVYVRQGASSVPASMEMIRRMIREADGESFENARSLNQELSFDFAEKVFQRKNVLFEKNNKISLGILNAEGLYTNLGLLLSDQCPLTVKAAVFKGIDKMEFQDRRVFDGSLLRQLNDLYEFADRYNPLSSRIKGLYRVDHRDFPEAAIREALVNALVHRDYGTSGSSFINVYADRLEILSLGGLPRGLSEQGMFEGISLCRNKKLADVFYRLELIEAYGTGILNIRSCYAGTGFQPEITPLDGAFKVVLPRIENGKTPVEEKSSDQRQETVLNLAERSGGVSRTEVQKALELSSSASGLLLRNLVEKGTLQRVGAGPATRYKLRAEERSSRSMLRVASDSKFSVSLRD